MQTSCFESTFINIYDTFQMYSRQHRSKWQMCMRTGFAKHIRTIHIKCFSNVYTRLIFSPPEILTYLFP